MTGSGLPYEDRMSISTPEGIDLDLSLAGLGSRVAAAFVDACFRGVLYLAMFLLLGRIATDLGLEAWAFAIFVPTIFLIEVGYDVVFETLNSGRTPGKQLNGLRVLRLDGRVVDFRTSAVRNVLRLIDGALTLYIAGSIAILATERNQRLGDLAAGTVVIRERRSAAAAAQHRQNLFMPPASLASWDVSAVTFEEIAAVRGFLDRRHTLEGVHRERIAMELAIRIGTKVVGATGQIHPEAFLEAIRTAKSLHD
jgi:uncharacterized RDD family membrane protein YckC